jgi:mannitol-specific phosphotransferase system IIBC component
MNETVDTVEATAQNLPTNKTVIGVAVAALVAVGVTAVIYKVRKNRQTALEKVASDIES